MSGGEAAGGHRSAVGWITVRIPNGGVACVCWLMGGLEVARPGGEAAAKCRIMGKLEFTTTEGQAAGGRRSVKERRVAEMPGGEAICRFWLVGGRKLECLVLRL